MGGVNSEVRGQGSEVSQMSKDIVADVWATAAAHVRAQLKEEIRETLENVSEATDEQKECRHQHRCHRLPRLWQAEDALKRMLREIEIQEGAALVNRNVN